MMRGVGTTLGKLSDENFVSVSQTNTKLAKAGINTNFGIIGDIGWYQMHI